MAFLLRAAWAFGVAEPLQYSHPYQYLAHSLWLAERPDAWSVVVNYDNWRVHYDRWTAAPLYYLFLLGIFRLLGPSVFWVRLIQCALGGMAAVSTARVGARISGSRGRWAGIAFALHLPLIQICATTLTEALYVPLMMLAFDLLLRTPSRANALRAGLTQGLAALTRSVSSAFFAVIAFWLLAKEGVRRGAPRVALLALGGMVTILPWSARNYFVMGEPVLIETFAWENLWYANALVGPGVKEAQRRDIASQKTTAEQRDRAVELTWQNLSRRPDRIPEKIWINIRHLIRPEGLQQWLTVRSDESMGRQALQVLLEDTMYLLAWAGLALFLFKKRWNRASTLTLLWLAYSLLMVVVLFHNEVRYRNQIAPFLFVTAIGGWFGPGGVRGGAGRAFLGRALAALIVFIALAPYPARALAVVRANADARDLAVTEPGPGVDEHTFWTERFQFLADAGHLADAADVFERLGGRAPVPMLVIAPRLLALLGPEHEAAARAAWVRSAAFEWTLDETRLQAIGWRRRPDAIRPDQIQLGSFDLGLISDFGPPLPRDLPESEKGAVLANEPTSRWTRGRSRLRLCAPSSGAATLTLRMAAPPPSPQTPTTAWIRFDGREVGTAAVEREPQDYRFPVVAGACPSVVEIRSAVWSTSDPPAELGVQVFFAGIKVQ
ncbi:MAG: hypothetical protein JJE39_02545 [Vicinamibacteria bacterium]|nr:hypothetical protein [Vicinamibacteria bacterium]